MDAAVSEDRPDCGKAEEGYCRTVPAKEGPKYSVCAPVTCLRVEPPGDGSNRRMRKTISDFVRSFGRTRLIYMLVSRVLTQL
jgi:hypothetical protein